MQLHRAGKLVFMLLWLSGVSAAQDQIQDAIDNYHKALALRPEDTLVAEMLTLAMQDSANTDYSF